MILLTRFPNGERFALNPDLIERAEENPDTVVTLSDGARYLVQERVEEIIEIVMEYRARILALANHFAAQRDEPGLAHLRLVSPPATTPRPPEPAVPGK